MTQEIATEPSPYGPSLIASVYESRLCVDQIYQQQKRFFCLSAIPAALLEPEKEPIKMEPEQFQRSLP